MAGHEDFEDIDNDYEYDDDYRISNVDDMSDNTRSLLPRVNIKEIVKRQLVREFYREIGYEHAIDNDDSFVLENKTLYLRYFDNEGLEVKLRLNKISGGQTTFYKLSSLKQKYPKHNIVKLLVLKTDEKIKKALNSVDIPNIENIPLEDLTSKTSQISDNLETILSDAKDDGIQETSFTLREIRGLDQTLKRFQGELANNVAKLSELDEHIEREKNKLDYADNDPRISKEPIERTLRDLYIERQSRLEVLDINRNKITNQVERIKATIYRMLNEDKTLFDKIKTLFREQGITIFSVITALGLIISSIVTALSGGGGSLPVTPPKPPPPSNGNTAKTWVKRQLHHLAELLKSLANKALASLPGILGSVISFLFKTASTVVGYMSEHLWTLIVFVAGPILLKIQKQNSKSS